jgi:hypothetical protein
VELVIFYKSKGLHEPALELLQKLSVGDECEQLKGIRPTIEYLQSINDQGLIRKYAKWVLNKDPIEGLKVLYNQKANTIRFSQEIW